MNPTDTAVTLNHNAAECVKQYDRWGETVYRNICSGTESVLPWGISDWMALAIMGLVCVTLIWSGVGIFRLFRSNY